MDTIYCRDAALLPIRERLAGGERLGFEDGVTLFRTDDLPALGQMARSVQRTLNGDAVTYARNQKIEPTNVCVLSCRFCEFALRRGLPGAYELTLDEVLARIGPEVREVHLTGGMPPDWPWERHVEMVRALRMRFPALGIKAFTAVEIDFFQRRFGQPVEAILRELKEAGLDVLPGGGAEVFSERVRRALFPQKIGADRWLDVHRRAHRLGIPSNATLLYGHIETVEERVAHLLRLRDLQDETGGFLSFVPLAFQPGKTGIPARPRTLAAVDDLKTIAVARLLLDNIPHIKAYWVMLGEETAAVALHFGADDLEGTVGGERIAHAAGAASPMCLSEDELLGMIRAAGRVPVERDVFHRPVRVHDAGPARRILGQMPYLNSAPFYADLDADGFLRVPLAPSRMGRLAAAGVVGAGPLSLIDYFGLEERLELLGGCIAAPGPARSVLLFSRHAWADLEGRRIGVTEESSTSVRLLEVLLGMRYGVRARLERLTGGAADFSRFDAVLLIGDAALRRGREGVPGFRRVYDLAGEWRAWQGLPFVFAVWAADRSVPAAERAALRSALERALAAAAGRLAAAGAAHGRRLGLRPDEAADYLNGFIYRLGDAERAAMRRFRRLADEVAAGRRAPAAAGREA